MTTNKDRKPSYLEYLLAAFIFCGATFMAFLGYEAIMAHNDMEAIFYFTVAGTSIVLIVGIEARSEWINSQKEIEELSKPPLPPISKPVYVPRPAYTTDRAGYVYVVTALHDLTVYKIGRTNNPKDRLRTFNVKLPFEVEYLYVIKTDDMYELEKRLHRKFAEKRVNGEWFRLDESDLAYLGSLATASPRPRVSGSGKRGG